MALLSAGDVLYGPLAWIHQVRNAASPTLGVTGNFVDVGDVAPMLAQLAYLEPLATAAATRATIAELRECYTHVRRMMDAGELDVDGPRRELSLHERGLRPAGARCE